jgi:hypothetical protein
MKPVISTSDRPLAAAWAEFRNCIPASASLEQFRDTREAFYAGANYALAAVCRITLSGASLAEQGAELQRLAEEALEFWQERRGS